MSTDQYRQELDDLHAAGVLTDTEYQDAKARLDQGATSAEAVAAATGASVDEAQHTINAAKNQTGAVATPAQARSEASWGTREAVADAQRAAADADQAAADADRAAADAAAAGHNAEPSEAYDPAAAHAANPDPGTPTEEAQ